ncbi:MAG: AAA family ATPase [Dehalococcoidia bacterium]
MTVHDIAAALGVSRARVERTLAVRPPTVGGEDPARVFVGRRRELVELQHTLATASAGRGSLVFVVGEAGVGKTRLVRELIAGTARRRSAVATGHCYEDHLAPPYRPWTELLRQLSRQLGPAWLAKQHPSSLVILATLLPELDTAAAGASGAPADPIDSRFWLFDAVAAFILDAARNRQLVLVLEDLHAADESSIDLLAFVGRHLSNARILLIGTYRETELGGARAGALATLVREAQVRHIALGRLTRDEVAEYLERVASGRGEELVDTVYERTDGNAFYLAQVANLMRAEALAPGAAQPSTRGVPEGVRHAVLGRLARLSPDARDLLLTASIVGREFDLEVLRGASNVASAQRLAALIDESHAAGILEAVAELGRFRFAHELVHEAITAELGPARAAQLHMRVAQVLEALYREGRDAHAAEILAHLTLAGSAASPHHVGRYAYLAGEQALGAYAFREATGYFRRALALLQDTPLDDLQAAVLLGLARAGALSAEFAHPGEALVYLRRGLDFHRARGDLPRALAAIEALPMSYLQEVVREHAELIDDLLPALPAGSTERARALAVHGELLGMSGDRDGAERAFDEALTIARAAGETAIEIGTLVRRATVRSYHELDPLADADAAARLARQLGAPMPELQACADRAPLVRLAATPGAPRR